MTQLTALSVGVKTAYLLGRVGSDHLEVTSFRTWTAAPALCPARPLCPMCLDKKQRWPTVCHTALSMSLLILLASISPSCNPSATWDVKMPICVPVTPLAPSLKHWNFLVCLEKKRKKKQLQSLIALTRICNFPKGRPRPPALLTLGQLSLYYACPQIISDHLWFTMASQVGIEVSLNWLWCSWRDESNLSSGRQLTIKATAVLGLMQVHLTVPKQSWRLQWLVPKRPSKTPCTSVYISLV